MDELISKQDLLDEISKLPLAWEYGQAVSDIYDIVKKSQVANTTAYIKQLEAERDAAVKALEFHKSCFDCKYSIITHDSNGYSVDCPKRDGHCRGLNLWEWRGVGGAENA